MVKDKEVTLNFILENYPNLVEDELFKIYLNELNPAIRTEKKYVLDLYEYIVKFNSIKDKLFVYNKFLPKELKKSLINEFIVTRSNINDTLIELGYSETDNFDILLLNINKIYLYSFLNF